MLPDPADSLSIFAEVAIALAGFSGIVIAFSRNSVEAYSALEVRRLANLFMLSGFVLLSALLGIALLHTADLSSTLYWSMFSGLILLLGTIWIVWDIRKVRQLAAEGASINTFLVVVFDSLASLALLLQLYNTIYLQQSWPVLVALTFITAGAFQQFILLVHMRLVVRATNDA